MPVWITTTWKVLDLLMQIPGLMTILSSAAEAVTLWFIMKQKKENLAKIADAAAFASQAETEEDRYVSSEKWREAFKLPRINS